MGIIANVYRTGSTRGCDMGLMKVEDCTNNGWSSGHGFDRVCVVNADGPFEPSDDCPAVMIVPHRTVKGAIHAISLHHHETKQWTMFGGNYLASSDSRFWELCERLGASRYHGAVAIHDRVE